MPGFSILPLLRISGWDDRLWASERSRSSKVRHSIHHAMPQRVRLQVVDAVAAKAKASGLPGVLPVFVTLDPYRDTCAQVSVEPSPPLISHPLPSAPIIYVLLRCLAAAFSKLRCCASLPCPALACPALPCPALVLQVGTYVKDFHPRMLGLTGTPAQVGRIAKAFRVYFQEVDHEEGSEDYLGAYSTQRAYPERTCTSLRRQPSLAERFGTK